jgi:hypothetical protein
VAHIATLLLSLLDAVHRAQGDAAGFLGCPARSNFLLDTRLDVEAKFLIQLSFNLRPAKNRA